MSVSETFSRRQELTSRLRDLVVYFNMQNVQQFIKDAWDLPHAPGFPGPQPVSIERRHFVNFTRQPYVVCEKTDGVRHLLVSMDEGTFLVNRAFHIEAVKIKIPKDSVLDGELVKLKNAKLAFIIHDAVRIKGEDLKSRPLTTRLEAAHQMVKKIIKTASAPFELRVKIMHPYGKVIDLQGFDYETDGLVFTPINEPIRTGTHETMFKWKPRERITIDFEIRNGKDLYVQDRGVPYKEAEIHLKSVDIPDGSIVECGFGELGWFVEKIRTDKNHANNRRTYFRTIINIRENIQISEFKI